MKTNELNRMNAMIVGAAAALCAAAGLATAQQVKVVETCDDAGCAADGERVIIKEIKLGEDSGDGDEQVVLVAQVQDGQPEVHADSHVVIVQQTDDDEFKIEMDGDKVKAWVNGERVPRKQVRVTDKEIRILDEDGKTIAEFGRGAGMVFSGDADMNGDFRRMLALRGMGNNQDGEIFWEDADGDGVFLPGGEGNMKFFPDGEGNMMFFGDDGEGMNQFQLAQDAPPVMVGINMGSLDSDSERLYRLLDERDLGEEDVIQVVGVIDDLPADEAGLREGDVIVRLDGEWGADPETLHEVLMDKEPGDVLEIGAVRNGRFREFEVELKAYNAEKLGAPDIMGMDSDSPFAYRLRSGGKDSSKVIEELTRKLAAQPGIDAEDIREQMEALSERLQSQGEFPGRMRLDVLPRMRGVPGEDGQPRFFVERAPRDSMVSGRQDDRLEKIENRLDRLESRIDRLLEILERNHD